MTLPYLSPRLTVLNNLDHFTVVLPDVNGTFTSGKTGSTPPRTSPPPTAPSAGRHWLT